MAPHEETLQNQRLQCSFFPPKRVSRGQGLIQGLTRHFAFFFFLAWAIASVITSVVIRAVRTFAEAASLADFAGAKITVKENTDIKPQVQGENGLEETGDFKVSQLYVTTGQYKDESKDAPSPVAFNGASVTIDSLPVHVTPNEPAEGNDPVDDPLAVNDLPAGSEPKPFVIDFINSAGRGLQDYRQRREQQRRAAV